MIGNNNNNNNNNNHNNNNNNNNNHTITPELNVTVLTTGFWPIVPVKDCILPPITIPICKAFSQFYIQSRNGRRLTWCSNLGTAELRCLFNKGKKELLVQTYQMYILMLFNQHDVLTYKEIAEYTKIPKNDLDRHLLSLAHPKVHVLKKRPNNKSLESNHQFMFNMNYTSQKHRVKIKLLQFKSNEEKQNIIPPAVMEARKLQIDASIVRIMKSRKSLDHNNLISEIIKQLSDRFTVDPTFVKKRIEGLIEREYLERDSNNRRLYNYLA